jgi:hypothetical protein
MIVTGQKSSKGGGGGGTESPNTLQSKTVVSIVEALGEGEIVGLVDGLKSIYFDNMPVQNFDGSMNREGVVFDTRVGLPTQEPLLGNTKTGTPVNVEQQVKYGIPIVRTVAEQADQVLVVARIPALAYQNKDNGDLTGTDLSWTVQVRATGGAWVTVETVDIRGQKCTSPYNRVTLVTRPFGTGTESFDIRIVRNTADSTEVTLQNDLFWESYIAQVKGHYQYPYTALVALQVDGEKFGNSLGTRSYHVKGLKTDVPSNYDPIARTYTGIWDGTFVKKWHNNPAWVFWDLITNNRYGLGEFVDPSLVDKWSLYQIAQYCDQTIPSGFRDQFGNPTYEPRFTFNGVINNRDEAYKVLQNITTAFRGMAYWSLGQVFASADMPADPVSVITPANVIDGNFNYSGTALKARHSVAMITWNDPQALYQPAMEVVQNDAMLTKFGWRQVDVPLTGCTSRGQAHRFGKWILDTEQNETETVQFTMSWDGYVLKNNQALKPGDIILVSDPAKTGNFRTGGRLAQVTSTSQVVMDAPFAPGAQSYSLTCMMPDGTMEKRNISGFSNGNKTLTLEAPFSQLPQVSSDFILEAVDLNARRYRVMAVEETDTHLFKVTALFHDPNKFARVEQNVVLEPIQYTRPRDIIRQPINVTSVESRYFQNGVSHSRLTISWTPPNDFMVDAYNITADSPRGFQAFPTTRYPSIDINDPVAGDWTFYISARSHSGASSVPTQYTVSVQGWQAVDGPLPSDLKTLEGGDTFSGRAPTLTWINVFPPDFVQYPVTNIVRVYDPVTSTLLRTERVTDPQYTYSYEDNLNDGGPRRTLRIDVSALNVTGRESDRASITVSNPVPAKIVPTMRADIGSIDVSWINTDNDYAGALVWASKVNGFTPDASTLKYDGPDTNTVVWVDNGRWYVRVALYDAFGKIGLLVSDQQQIDISDLTSTLAEVVPALIEAKGQVTIPVLEKTAEDISDQIAGVLAQVIADRDDNDELHKRTTQKLSVKTDKLSAIVAEETSARIEGDYAEAVRRQILEVTVNTTIIAAIAAEQLARSTADEALTVQINSAISQFTTDIDAANAEIVSTKAALQSESTTRANADGALTTQLNTAISDYTSKIADANASIVSTNATLATEQTTRADADTALTTQITNAVSDYNSKISSTNASLSTESTTRANADSALSGQYSSLSTTVNGHTSNISTLTTSVDGVKVQYGVIGTIDGTTGGFVFTGVRRLDGSVSYTLQLRGDLIVDGTIAASKLIVSALSSITANLGTVTAGTILSQNNVIRQYLNEGRIEIWDNT